MVYVAVTIASKTMRDRFSVCENPYYTCFSYSPNNQRPQPKNHILICGCFVFVCPSVRTSASASIRPRPSQTGRSPDQSVVVSSDFESSVNVTVFAHAESIPHGFRGCRDRYIRQLEITLIFVCPYVLSSVSGESGGRGTSYPHMRPTVVS